MSAPPTSAEQAGAPSRKRRPYAARVPAEVRREQLLDAALAIIVRDGYEAVSVDAIAKEVGVTRPVVYGVFDGLRELLVALLDRQQERALAQLATALPADPDFSDLAAVAAETVRRLVEVVRTDPLTWRPILLAPGGVPDQVRSRIERDRENFVAQVAALLEIGVALRGGPPVDAEVAGHAVLAVLEHFGRILLLEPDRFETERLVDAVTGLVRALS